MRADEVAYALQKRHSDETFWLEVKNGRSYRARGGLAICDAISIKRSYQNPCITGYEIKVSKGDFLGDEKWPSYLPMCHRFYFATPKGLVQKGEVPEVAGLVWVNEHRVARVVKRAPYRNIELPVEMLLYLLYSRTESDRHPFFSNAREACEAYIADSKERDKLGHAVKSKLRNQVAELFRRANEKELLAGHLSKELERIKGVLTQRGLPTDSWSLDSALRRKVGEVDPEELKKLIQGAVASLRQIEYEIQKL